MKFAAKVISAILVVALFFSVGRALYQPSAADNQPPPIARAPSTSATASPAPAAPPPAPHPVITPVASPVVPVYATNGSSSSVAAQPPATPPETPAPPPVNQLGTVEFTDGVPLQVNLDQNRTCTITPKVLPDGTLQLSMVIQGPGARGTMDTLSSPKIICPPGMAVAVSVGDLGIGLTPTIKSN
jgi:hypothetical protein